jgi:hypothetical protein
LGVRVLIQNCLTGKFLSATRRWTVRVEQAEDFQKTLRAWSAIDEGRLSGVRIILQLGDGAPDVPLANVGTQAACGKTSVVNSA